MYNVLMETNTMKFTNLFTEIHPEEIPFNVFTLIDKILPVITAGTPKKYNSMIASGGGMGTVFRKPATWIVLAQKRYTLELIQQQGTYTLSFFPNEYKEKTMMLGKQSGRDSHKMNEIDLIAIETPQGNMTYEEANLVVECKLTQATTPLIEDFVEKETREYLVEAYKDPGEVRKFLFGEITAVWLKIE